MNGLLHRQTAREMQALIEPVQQRLYLLQITGIEAFGEPAKDGRQEIAGRG